jgi:hypothetical protein
MAVNPCGHEVGIEVQMSVSIRWPKNSYPVVDGSRRDAPVPRVDAVSLLGAVALLRLASRVLPSRQPWQSAASKIKPLRLLPPMAIWADPRRRSLQ